MLDTLRSIVQEVCSAKRLDEVLNVILKRVKSVLDVDAVSIYLLEEGAGAAELVLRASLGLNEKAIGKIRLSIGEGLVGFVAERAEAQNLDNANAHPRFKFFPESGEDVLNAFLGVPIIHYGKMRGVLVAQQCTPRLFNEDHVAFLITLAAQIGGAITQASISQDMTLQYNVFSPRREPKYIEGLPGSPGVVIGEAVVVYTLANFDLVPDRVPDSIPNEIESFKKAIDAACGDMRRIAETMKEVLPVEELALFEAYEMMLDGGPLVDDTIERIKNNNWAQGAFRETIQQYVKVFREFEDSYLQERASDIIDLGRRVLMHLQSRQVRKTTYPKKTILIGEDISPMQLAEIPPECLAGIISLHGSGSSHVAILARAMQVPAVMGATGMPIGKIDGYELVMDGYTGRIYIQPNRTLKREYSRLAKQEKQLSKELQSLVDKTATTTDGVRINLLANTGLVSDVTPCLQSGAEGVGLYRTEIPFQVRSRFPSEEEQCDIYRQVLQAFAPKPVVVRTLDVGGDKPLDYFPIQEDNPFLGWRGIRITLDHPEIFLTQIRAMLKANHGLGNMRMMLPMICSMRELYEAKQLIEQAHTELYAEGYHDPLPLMGMMIEVPSSLYLMDVLAQHVDFFSIGTNDLTQYLLAVDRNNERVARLYDSLHPAVLHAILHAADAAKRYDKPLSVCGELAGDPLGALCLMGMGVQSLSMSAGSLLKVKQVIRSFSAEDSQDIVSAVLLLEDGQAVRIRLLDELERAGLGGLVRAGK